MDKVNAYTKKLKTDLVEVIGAAVKNLEPATLKFGAGQGRVRHEPPRADREGNHQRDEPHRPGRSHGAGAGDRGQGRQAESSRVRLRLPQHHARRYSSGAATTPATLRSTSRRPSRARSRCSGRVAAPMPTRSRDARSNSASSTARNSPTPSSATVKGEMKPITGKFEREVRDDLAQVRVGAHEGPTRPPIRSARRSPCSGAPNGCSRNSKRTARSPPPIRTTRCRRGLSATRSSGLRSAARS